MPANVEQQERSALRTMVPRLYGVVALEQWVPISRSASCPVLLAPGASDLSLEFRLFLRLDKTSSLT